MGIVKKFPKDFLTLDEFHEELRHRSKLAEADMDVLDPNYDPRGAAAPERGATAPQQEPSEEECMRIRNKALIEHWNKNLMTVADLTAVAMDMQQRLSQQGVRKHGNESIYRYEKRSQRWREIAETALRAVKNAIEDRRIDEANDKRKGYH